MQFLDCKITLSFSNQKIKDRSETLINKGMYEVKFKFIVSLIILNNYLEGIGPVNYYTSEHSIDAAFKFLEVEKAYRDALDKMTEGKKKEFSMTFNGMNYVGCPLCKSELPFALNAFFKGDSYHCAATRAMGLMKRYQSEYKGKMQVNYDECEWRMVFPEFAEIAKNKLLDNWSLPFAPRDINYLIVPTNKQIPIFIKALSRLKEVCGNTISIEERSQLYSRVISFEQIESDF